MPKDLKSCLRLYSNYHRLFNPKSSPMLSYLAKVLFSAVIIVLITELSKRANTMFAALLAAIPLTSLIAIVLLYYDTKNKVLIESLSYNIFWLVLPSLSFFLILPLCLQKGLNFPLSISLSSFLMILLYGALILLLKFMGIK